MHRQRLNDKAVHMREQAIIQGLIVGIETVLILSNGDVESWNDLRTGVYSVLNAAQEVADHQQHNHPEQPGLDKPDQPAEQDVAETQERDGAHHAANHRSYNMYYEDGHKKEDDIRDQRRNREAV